MARTPISVSFDPLELKQLNRLVRLHHTTRSTVLKEAFREYLRRLEFDMLRREGRRHAIARGLITDEDIFRVVS